MSIHFQQWLSALGDQRADLDPATRGQRMEHTFTYPGDVRSGFLKGVVKSEPNSPVVLAEFDISEPQLFEGDTVWIFSLSPGDGVNSTGSLPMVDQTGMDYFLYDLIFGTIEANASRVAAGLLPVSGFITEPAEPTP